MTKRFQIEIDHEADAAYVTIEERPIARTTELDIHRMLDLDDTGQVVGIELLRISSGVSLSGLPYGSEIARLLSDANIKAYA
jgi:uncharacterized protein YuzE